MQLFFNQLFDYNFFCNKKLIESCREFEEVPENTQRLFSHILNAHHVWNARVLDQPPKFQVWQLQPLSEWEDIHYDNQRESFQITSNAEDFHKRIVYENSEGRAFTNTLQDILFHILNHSTHHRAQIVSDFRNHDLEPPALDYIFYRR